MDRWVNYFVFNVDYDHISTRSLKGIESHGNALALLRGSHSTRVRPFREDNYPNENWGWGTMRTNHRSSPANRSKRSSKTRIAFCDRPIPVS